MAYKALHVEIGKFDQTITCVQRKSIETQYIFYTTINEFG